MGSWRRGGLALLLALLALPASSAAAAPPRPDAFEPEPVLRAGELLPPALLRSENHRVRDEVGLESDFLGFVLESDFGIYEIVSRALLEIRVDEVRILSEALRQYVTADGPLAESLRGQLSISSDSVVSILASPVSTATELAGQLSTNIWDTLTLQERAPPAAGPELAPDRGPIFDAHKRSIAHQLSLDVYSTNPRVQAFLERVAEARSAGTFSAGSGVVVGPPRVPTRKVDGGRVERQVRRLVRHLSRPELDEGIAAELLGMGVPAPLVSAFVAHRWISPRVRTAIAAHLDFLRGVAGRAALVAQANAAGSEAEALASEQMVTMLAAYHEERPLERMLDGVPAAVAADGRLVVALPVDLVTWSARTAETFERFLAGRGRPGAGDPVEVLLRGQLTARARRELAALGLSLREGFLSLPPPPR